MSCGRSIDILFESWTEDDIVWKWQAKDWLS